MAVPTVSAYSSCAARNKYSSTLVFRPPTRGPEYDLVRDYVDDKLPKPPRGQVRTVFLEPRIASGFPDAVAVYWHRATASRWSTHRQSLSKGDIRVLHYLALAGATGIDDLTMFFAPGVDLALTRLADADLITRTKTTWRARPLSKIFAVRRLISIEAKMGEWQAGLHQAFRNTWFASESYLLLPSIPRNGRVMGEAEKHGVGVITREQRLDDATISARQDRIPKSYASWLFNEWVWGEGEAANLRGDICTA